MRAAQALQAGGLRAPYAFCPAAAGLGRLDWLPQLLHGGEACSEWGEVWGECANV